MTEVLSRKTRQPLGWSCTPQQFNNLERTVAWLRSLDETSRKTFTMLVYNTPGSYGPVIGDGTEERPYQYVGCGTQGCVVGHIPDILPEQFGQAVLMSDPILAITFWKRLSTKAFGHMLYEGVWQWMFDAGWGHVDNTPEGVALRIEYVLDNGAPPPFATEEWLDSFYSPQNRGKSSELIKQWNLSGQASQNPISV